MTKRTYQDGDFIVHWDSGRCIHSGLCLRGLPSVFDFDARPWVQLADADLESVATTIETCPSGALSYERISGASEPTPAVTTVVPRTNGPLFIHGAIEVRDVQGNLFATGTRMTLCRCGHSQNQPFCDNSHRASGFKDRARVVTPERDEAEHPEPPSSA